MNRNKIHYITEQNNQIASTESIIFHEAGHAAAIYLNNKAHNLPPVFFQIILKGIRNQQQQGTTSPRAIDGDCIDKIEGGRLIQSLLPAIDVTDDYMAAFEADVVNLLIGPLAEAKYVHECDDELFTACLVNIAALNNYGGRDDLALANEYLQSVYPNKQQQDEKLHQLFIAAFNFVTDRSNWQSINRLAHYIHESNKSMIGFEEVVSVLESVAPAANRLIVNA